MGEEVKKEVVPETELEAKEVEATHILLPINTFNEVFGFIMSKPMGEVEQIVGKIRQELQTTALD